MKLKSITKRIIILIVIALIQFTNNNIKGQSWSLEYSLQGDSTIYTLSKDKILHGKSVDFFFPAYKFYQTASKTGIQSERVGHTEIIELKFDSKNRSCNKLNFESNLYAEGIDSIWFFLKTLDNHMIPVIQKDVLREYKGYTYLPTIYFSANNINDSIKSIQIVGTTNTDKCKFILGRLTGSKQIGYIANNMTVVDSLLSKYPFEKQSDSYVYLPDFYLKFHGLGFIQHLVLKNCQSTYDSIQCISQFTNMLLNEYGLYDVYGINKQELIDQNVILAKTSYNIDNYYIGMKKIIVSLNSCHYRLSTGGIDDIESPVQPIYFYNINNKITISAIFDTTLVNKIQLDDKLLSINHVPLEQLYHDLSMRVFASSPQQREIKITQKILYLARELFGDSLLLEFQNSKNNYYIGLNKVNFTCKKIIPSNFKIISENTIEKFNNIIYLKPFFKNHLLFLFYIHTKRNLIIVMV